jgi:hypothetical protein
MHNVTHAYIKNTDWWLFHAQLLTICVIASHFRGSNSVLFFILFAFKVRKPSFAKPTALNMAYGGLMLHLKCLVSVFFFLIMDCEAIVTTANPGLLCQPRVIMKMIVEK